MAVTRQKQHVMATKFAAQNGGGGGPVGGFDQARVVNDQAIQLGQSGTANNGYCIAHDLFPLRLAISPVSGR